MVEVYISTIEEEWSESYHSLGSESLDLLDSARSPLLEGHTM